MTPRYGEPLFVISVAARLVEMHPQTLRKYEREGLIAPSRTTGNLRLYSDRDIERLRQVKYLVEERGLNLAGVQLALDLTAQIRDLRSRVVPGPGSANGAANGASGNVRASGEAATHLRRELDGVLALLGYIDEADVRASRGGRD
jgi:MerR family transcriptional regulator/heat shock protein HspR